MEQYYFKQLTSKYKLRKIRAFVSGRMLIQMELEFYSRPSRSLVSFLYTYLSGYHLKSIYFSSTAPSSLVLLFRRYTHRNTFFQILDALANFMDLKTKIVLEYTRE